MRTHSARLALTLLFVSATAVAAPKKAAVHLDEPGERLTLVVLASYATGVSDEQVRSAAKTLVAASRDEGVDPFLVLGVIRVESSGRSHARSECDARGMMQLMPFVAKAMAKETGAVWGGAASLHDPEVNLRLGIHYLSTLLVKYDGDTRKALSAYSMGPSKLDSILRRKKTPLDDYPVSVRWFADRYRELAATHGDVEPGLSRFDVALRSLEKEIGGKPSTAYALATGKKEKDGWGKRSKTRKPTVAVAKLELNTATFSELLLAHPTMTASAAKLILDDREANGPFPAVDALDRVAGLDKRLNAALRDVTVVSGVERPLAALISTHAP